MFVGKHHYDFQCCPELPCTFYVPNKVDKNVKYEGTAIKAMTQPTYHKKAFFWGCEVTHLCDEPKIDVS